MTLKERLMLAIENVGPSSVNELCVLTGKPRDMVFRAANALHRAGQLHISDWTRSAEVGRFGGVYSLGAGEDKPRPAAKTSTERVHAFRRRQGEQA